MLSVVNIAQLFEAVKWLVRSIYAVAIRICPSPKVLFAPLFEPCNMYGYMLPLFKSKVALKFKKKVKGLDFLKKIHDLLPSFLYETSYLIVQLS